jgi:hypothetical protein
MSGSTIFLHSPIVWLEFIANTFVSLIFAPIVTCQSCQVNLLMILLLGTDVIVRKHLIVTIIVIQYVLAAATVRVASSCGYCQETLYS